MPVRRGIVRLDKRAAAPSDDLLGGALCPLQTEEDGGWGHRCPVTGHCRLSGSESPHVLLCLCRSGGQALLQG